MTYEQERGQRDLVLAPNEFAFIQDATKGGINVYVGPHKTSLAGTDKPVLFDYKNKEFKQVSLERCVQRFTIAPEGWYITLKNPADDNKNPREGTSNTGSDLNIGRKINIPGPASFALWPGQMVKIVQGHQLKSNQYLTVKIYDDKAAAENWDSAILKARDEGEVAVASKVPEDLAIGKLYIIKGTEVSFYIPPTGVEVVPDEKGNYVREAVTLERLEYTILLGEDGEKRFVKGPAVVFPEPTEQFITKEGNRKFKAIELNDNSGIYIKVIADYEDHKAGDELFITGKEQKLYYPRAEHAIIRYGNENVQYGMAVPLGEGRYTLNRESGAIDLVEGPKILLPDPRTEVLIRRVLTDKQASLWYPGNVEALRLNQELRKIDKTGSGFVTTRGGDSRNSLADMLGQMTSTVAAYSAVASDFVGDEFERKKAYTPTEALVLDTKYEGAINVGIWPGYAIQLVNKKGERRVVEGPRNVLLRYEEDLSVLSLSSGKPKTTDDLFETVYLKIKGNKVGDVITVETSDMVKCQVKVSLLVNFEGDHDKWFDIDNYVKLLTDHVRSILKDKVKRLSIEDFYTNAITYIRDTILGAKEEVGERTGLVFEENGMRVYDVEILDVKVGDRRIAELLMEAQEQAVSDNLTLIRRTRELESTKRLEAIAREISAEKTATAIASVQRNIEINEAEHNERLKEQEADATIRDFLQQVELGLQEGKKSLSLAKLEVTRLTEEQALELAHKQLEQYREKLIMEAEAMRTRGEAISPQMVAAMQAFGDKALIRELSQSMGALAIANGTSPVTEIQKLLNNTPLADVVGQLAFNSLLGGKAENE